VCPEKDEFWNTEEDNLVICSRFFVQQSGQIIEVIEIEEENRKPENLIMDIEGLS
jgi:hypothetical protein